MRVVSKSDREIIIDAETPEERSLVDQLVEWRHVIVTRVSSQQMLNQMYQSYILGQMRNVPYPGKEGT